MRFKSCDFSRKFSRFFILMLAMVMAMSIFMVSGCSDKDNDDVKPTATATASATATPKPALIKNGNFEDTYDTSYPKTPKYWTVYGDSFGGQTESLSDPENKKFKYGIINTDTTVFDENKEIYGNVANPGVSEGSTGDDKNVIMIYNKTASAVKYKSQSITLPANSFGVISLYVKTVGIEPTDAANAEDYENYGAMISLSGMDEPVIITGINTESGSGSIWKEFKFYVEGSPTSSKTIYVEIGLGSGSPANSLGYTKGHAFFDSIKLDYINKKDYVEIADTLIEKDAGANVYDSKTDRYFYFDNNKYDESSYEVNRFDVKDKGDWTEFAYTYKNAKNITEIDLGKTGYIEVPVSGNYSSQVNPDNFNNDHGFLDIDDEAFDGKLANYPLLSEQPFLLWNKEYGTQGRKTDDFDLEMYGYYRIGVYVKTSDFTSGGFNILLTTKDATGKDIRYNWFNNINTTAKDLDEEALKEDANLHNKWSNWVEYVFYVQGSPYENLKFNLEFWLGPKTVSMLPLSSFVKGYALISDFSIQKLTSSEYSSASSGDTVKTGIVLYDSKSPTIANGYFNTSVAGDYNNIGKKPTTPASWTGYFGGAKGLLKDGTLVTNHNNGDVWAGIINEDYLAQYVANGYTDGTLTNIKLGTDYVTSPNYLMINNVKNSAYGYVSPIKSLSAESYYKFEVMVKTYGGAKAFIYLTDGDGNVLEVGEDVIEYSSITDTGWTLYTIYVQTGELTKSAKIEIWNGARDGSTLSKGYVLFDDVTMNTVTETRYNDATESAIISKYSYDGIDVKPTETAVTETPTQTPTATPQPGKIEFQWGLLTTLLIAVVLIFVMIVILVRRAKNSKLLRKKKIKVVVPSYSRDKVKYSKKKVSEETEEDNEEELSDEDAEEAEEYEENSDSDPEDK